MENLIQGLIEEFTKNKNLGINTSEEFTPRVAVVKSFLDEHNIPYEIDTWKIQDRILFNVYIRFDGETEEYRLFDAHHDVINTVSENAQDNTCSVINLLMLAKSLSIEPIANSVLIAITDGEEPLRGGGGSGARRLIEKFTELPIYSAYALELTGLGDSVWHNSRQFNLEFSTNIMCPFNNATIYNAKYNSTCIGILPRVEIDTKISTWQLCHSINDTFDKCSIEDMINFVLYLRSIATSDMAEVEDNNDPFYRLTSIGLLLRKNYSNRIKVNISTDIITGEAELLILPSLVNPLFKIGYYKVTFESKFYLQAWDETHNVEIRSAVEIINILERKIEKSGINV